ALMKRAPEPQLIHASTAQLSSTVSNQWPPDGVHPRSRNSAVHNTSQGRSALFSVHRRDQFRGFLMAEVTRHRVPNAFLFTRGNRVTAPVANENSATANNARLEPALSTKRDFFRIIHIKCDPAPSNVVAQLCHPRMAERNQIGALDSRAEPIQIRGINGKTERRL